MPLYPVKYDTDHRVYCGPAALASITGKPVSTVLAAVLTLRKGRTVTPSWVRTTKKLPKAPVVGMTNWEAVATLKKLGWRVIERQAFGRDRPTLAAFAGKLLPGVWLVGVTDHFVAVSGRTFCDTKSRQPVPLRDAPQRRKLVNVAWRLCKGK
jgi:hypothetical protein